jgi:hypothetical protein
VIEVDQSHEVLREHEYNSVFDNLYYQLKLICGGNVLEDEA